jgi:hypothetical protein
MGCAVVDLATNIVVNIIVADAATDAAPDGCLLVNTESPCGIGWTYDPVIGDFIDPNPPEQEAEDTEPLDEGGSG